MKKIVTIVGVFLVLVSAFSFRNSITKRPDVVESNSIAVVELFTSQGCSSCPAADKVLSKIVNEATTHDQPVYALSFHVSYWNYLGWKDPYSSEEYTKRQRSYGQAFRLGSIYTPQMIVNGKHEFVGSSADRANKIVKAALNNEAKNKVVFTMVSKDTKKVSVDFKVEGEIRGKWLNVAIVERDVENNVPRGENRGRKLHHDNVVRNFKTIEAKNAGKIEIDLPKDLNFDKSSVIVYAQDRSSWEISGAASAPLK